MWNVFAAAATTVLCLFLLNFVGILMYYKKLLSQPILKQLSVMCTSVFFPCLIVSKLSKSLSVELLSSAFVLPVFAFLQILFALGIAFIVSKIMFIPKHLKRIFITSSSFHNSNAFPLVIAQALSSQYPFNKDPDSFEKMATYVFIYVLGWSAIFWTWGFGYLSVNENVINNDQNKQKIDNSWKFIITKGFLNPPMIANYVAFIIGLILPLKNLFHGDAAPLAFITNTVDILGQPAVGIVTLIISGTLGKVIIQYIERRNNHKKKTNGENENENIKLKVEKEEEKPPSIGRDGQENAVNKNPLVNIKKEGKKDSSVKQKMEEPSYSTAWLIAKLCFLRVIIIGSLQFTFVALLIPVVLPQNIDPLIKLILLIECIPPSANLNLVVSQMAGNIKAAEFLALAYVFMYLLMLITMMFYLSIAIFLVYGSG